MVQRVLQARAGSQSHPQGHCTSMWVLGPSSQGSLFPGLLGVSISPQGILLISTCFSCEGPWTAPFECRGVSMPAHAAGMRSVLSPGSPCSRGKGHHFPFGNPGAQTTVKIRSTWS